MTDLDQYYQNYKVFADRLMQAKHYKRPEAEIIHLTRIVDSLVDIINLKASELKEKQS